ncbi:hypothetical protein MKEN_00814800 [Mycena kentingensis (nom. inval.)]|nr:hypothetical protein MKEN_00814800 [Mycena kentingensis (nom. inval.)]
MSAQRHCVCFRCIDDDHPNGKLISAKQYNRHRLQDAYMAVPLSKTCQNSPTDADYDHADYEDESPDSSRPTSPLPRSSPEPRSSSPYDEGISPQLGLDVEMDDLTDNLGPEEPLTYDPRNLPLRTHEEFYAQAKEVSDARTAIAADELARKYGIKGLPILYHVKSLRFPHSFPFDFMHLIWENLIPNLILLWTNEFKGLDHGMRDYTIDKAIWEAVGKQTAEAGDTIPGAFGARVPNMQNKGGVQVSAEMHATWTQFIAPTCLRNAFKDRAYYDHFVLLVQILTKCLQFDITRQELDWLRVKIPLWVEKYEEIYYQYDPRRLSTCTLTIHALLHIPDSIEMAGPQWCYWAYPMERFCGRLQPGIRNRRFPYPSLDRHVLETARITQIGMLYNISHELSMKHSRQEDPKGSARVDGYDAALLIGPHKEVKIRDIPNYTVLVSALATRWGLAGQVGDVKDILRPSFCTEWSKIRRVDSEAGDTMVAYSSPSSAMHNREDSRDATFVRYEMYTDRNERRRTVDVELQGEQFYGRLQHIYRINLNNAEPITTEPKSKKVKPITIPRWYSMIIVEVESCILTDVDKRLDLPFYKAMGRPHMTDATSLACVVGRVPDGQGGWGIVDRSGNLARAMYIDDL